MIDLDWFEQFSEFKSFHFIIKYKDFDISDFCSSYLSFDFSDAFSFIRDFINHNYIVTNFDYSIKGMNIAFCIYVECL